MAPPRLVCLGNLTIDDLALPDGRQRLGCVGGDALYATLAARLWEGSAEMVAPIGADFPAATLARIEARGLSLAGLRPCASATLRNRVAYAADGGRSWTLFSTEDDFHALSPRPEDIPAGFRDAEAFMVLAMTLAAQEALVRHLRSATGAIVALDPQEDYIAGNQAALRRLIAQADIFMPSAEEVRRLLGHEDWPAAARTFASWGPGIVALKLGDQGCIVYDKGSDGETHMPAFPASVLDTTGAGDCFCGGFLASFLQDRRDLEAAARAGAVAASFGVEDYGAERMFGVAADEARGRFIRMSRGSDARAPRFPA